MESKVQSGGGGGFNNDVEEVSGNISNNNNPMMNDVILTHLFHVTSPKQLDNFRLICKQWNSNALPPWLQSRKPLQLTNHREEDTFLKFVSEVHLHQEEDNDESGSSDHHQSILKRFPKFEITIYHLYPYQLFEIFWGEAGPWITKLSLNFQPIQFPELITFKNILTCKYTPNLESLDLKMDRMLEELDERLPLYWVPPPTTPRDTTKLKRFKLELGTEQNCIGFLDWKVFLSYHPNLTHFGIKDDSYRPEEAHHERILDAITGIRSSSDPDKLALKSFQWYTNSLNPLPATFCETLRKANWRLESFNINVHHEDEETIHNILSLHADTLKNLEIEVFTAFERFPICPRMDLLQSLDLTWFHINNLQFLRDLPSLRSLSIWHGRRGGILFSATQLEEGTSFPSISKFCCNFYADWTADDIIRLARWMPNVTHLGLMLTNNGNFRQVCTSLPQLEHLEVYLPESSVNSLGDRGIVGLVQNGDDEVNYALPNITSLQMLRSLELMATAPDTYGQFSEDFTEHSINHGFRQLPKLEVLRIDVVGMNPHLKELIDATFPFADVRISQISD